MCTLIAKYQKPLKCGGSQYISNTQWMPQIIIWSEMIFRCYAGQLFHTMFFDTVINLVNFCYARSDNDFTFATWKISCTRFENMLYLAQNWWTTVVGICWLVNIHYKCTFQIQIPGQNFRHTATLQNWKIQHLSSQPMQFTTMTPTTRSTTIVIMSQNEFTKPKTVWIATNDFDIRTMD